MGAHCDDGGAGGADACVGPGCGVECAEDPECDDGVFCNGVETCSAEGACTPGTPPDVDDGLACTEDACDEATRAIVHLPSDAACDDGDDCTTDTCDAVLGCIHPNTCACTDDAECDDGNPCTADGCVEGTCAYDPNTAPCDDGLFCNGADTCAGGTCSVHAGDPCAGGAECASVCDEADGTCNLPESAPCTDDGNACTDDVCDGQGACTHPDNTAPCDDGLFCNGADTCAGGACDVHAGDPCLGGPECASVCDEADGTCNLPESVPCTDDGNGCTDDVCDGQGACTHPDNTAPCDDGLFCNGADTCAGGACSKHVGDPCAGGAECADVCDEAGGSCNLPANSACTDDGNACTDDVCDGQGACTHPDNTAPCDDGLFCNGGDTCAGGACGVHAGDPCVGGPECANVCDEPGRTCNLPADSPCASDGNPCTDDLCSGAGACLHPDNTAPCDDGLFCNGADVCSGGTCSLHEGDPCVGGGECADTCDEVLGTCDRPLGFACTDDGNPCTDDHCDGGGQCAHLDLCCGNGVLDPGETCGEAGASCTASQVCSGCRCIPACPPEMVRIGTSAVCIDRYEASKAPDGKAQSAAGVMPWIRVTWDGAVSACRGVGKHLCSSANWRAACQGPNVYTYPYGPTYIDTACNDGTLTTGRVRPTGSFPGCEGGYPGIFDMAGNVNEWVAACTGPSYCYHYGLSAYASPASCLSESFLYRANSEGSVGFRCCRPINQ